MIARLPVAGEKNPYRTPADNMPIPERLAEWVEDETGKQKLTLSKLGYHQYGGFTLYRNPSTMWWCLVDSDGNEPLGTVRTKDLAHKVIDEYNRKQERINLIDRIRDEEEEARHNQA